MAIFPGRKSGFDFMKVFEEMGQPPRPRTALPGIGPGSLRTALGGSLNVPREAPMMIGPDALARPDGATLPMGEIAPLKGGGIFDRIGDFIGSDRGKAALLRSGAATLDGGLGAGIAAGANYIDGEKANDSAMMRWMADQNLKERGVDIDQQQADQQGQSIDQQGEYQDSQVQLGMLDRALDQSKLSEQVRSSKKDEYIRLRGQNLSHDQAMKQIGLGYRQDDTARARIGEDARQFDGVSGDTRYRGEVDAFLAGQKGETSDVPERTTVFKYPGVEAKPGGYLWGDPVEAQPERTVTLKEPVSPGRALPKVGEVVNGRTYLGGDPRNPKSWR